ncbi:MAG: glycerol-3-phosphate 1-O-acyltransferase PlsY [Bacteroidales bacterium]|nr:glycerol-3-phosphate 1-O-acyltransferase PlsY [Bacteroidales bacterium]
MGLKIILAIISAYLIGSIPTSVWIGRLFFGIDIRTKGSKNAGATNTIRVLGTKTGIPVLIIDILKGWFAVYMIKLFDFDTLTNLQISYLSISMATAAVIGHIFPIYVGFKGGKGVASLLGVGIALYPVAIFITIGVFVIVLLISRYVSLASISAAISFPLTIFILFPETEFPLKILSIAVAIFLPLTHRKNIKRLLNKEESKFQIRKEG